MQTETDYANLQVVINSLKRVNVMLSVKLDEQLERQLDALAEKTNRSKNYLAEEALKHYINQEEARESEKQEILARWEHYQETGEAVSNDVVTDWLDSWGTAQEKPCPVK